MSGLYIHSSNKGGDAMPKLKYVMQLFCSIDTGQKVIGLYNQINTTVEFYLDYDMFKGLIPHKDGFSYVRGYFNPKHFLKDSDVIRKKLVEQI